MYHSDGEEAWFQIPVHFAGKVMEKTAQNLNQQKLLQN